MASKNEAIYTFLTDLAHARRVQKRLLDQVEAHPELVMTYIESLGQGWRTTQTGDLLEKLRRIADESLAGKQPRNEFRMNSNFSTIGIWTRIISEHRL
jgi:hypothetical protein